MNIVNLEARKRFATPAISDGAQADLIVDNSRRLLIAASACEAPSEALRVTFEAARLIEQLGDRPTAAVVSAIDNLRAELERESLALEDLISSLRLLRTQDLPANRPLQPE